MREVVESYAAIGVTTIIAQTQGPWKREVYQRIRVSDEEIEKQLESQRQAAMADAETNLAQICIDNGWYMSFAGNITIKRNQHLRDSLIMAPKELILVETDAPFLAPEPFRGRPNAPYLVPITVRFMAEQRGVEVDELAAQLALNTESVYGSWAEGF